MEENITTKFKVDLTELKKGITEANKNIKLANAEFKAATAGMDDWTKSADGISAKLKQLQSILDAENRKLESYQKQLEAVEKAEEENGKRADDLRKKYKEAAAQFGETSTEAKKYQTALNNVEKEQDNNRNAADKLRITILNQEATVKKTEKEIRNYNDELKNADKELDNYSDAAKNANDSTTNLSGGFTVMKGALSSLVADGIKSAIGALKDLVTESDNAYTTLQARTGMSTAEMEKFQEQMDELYAENYGESMEDIADAMSAVVQTTKETDPNAIKDLTKNAIVLRDTFGFDFTETMRAVNMLMDQFGISGKQAYNLIVQGAQQGLNKNGNLLDTINEYSVHYANMGASAEGFFNSLLNGTEDGTFEVDRLGDAYKELGIQLKDTSDSTSAALSTLGYSTSAPLQAITETKEKIEELETKLKYATLEQQNFNDKTSELTKIKNADKIKEYSEELKNAKETLASLTAESNGSQKSVQDLQQQFAAGGDSAKQAVQEVVEKLFALDDEVQRNQVGVALFGTKWEDLGADAIKALTDTNGTISLTKSAMQELDEVQMSSLSKEFETLGRQVKSEAAAAFKDDLVPIIMDFLDELKKNDTIKKFTEALSKLAKAVLPTVAKLLGFVAENFDTLVGVTATAVGLFKALKSAMAIKSIISGFASAVSGLSGGIKIATAVQYAWNTALTANPIGLIVTAIGLLVGGIATLSGAMDDQTSDTDEWIESQNNYQAELEETIQDYKDIKEESKKAADADLAQMENVQALYGELQTLVDQNGKVKEADKARADFILKELNNALDTEYSMNGNIIEQYSNMKDEVYKLIEAKKADILLESYRPMYEEAIKNEMTLRQEMSDAYARMVAKENELAQEQAALQVILEIEKNQKLNAEQKKEKEGRERRIEEEIKPLLQKELTAYSNAEAAIRQCYSDIGKYEQASTYILQGETEKAIELLNGQSQAFKTADNTANESAEEQARILRQQVQDTANFAVQMKEWYRRGVEGITEDMVKTAEEQAKKAKEEFEEIGGSIVDGISEGAEENQSGLFATFEGLWGDLAGQVKKLFGIHSPSRWFRDEIGKMLPLGMAVGIEDESKSVLTAIRTMTNNASAAARASVASINADLQSGMSISGGNYRKTAEQKSIVVNQYNTSPKPLNRLEIYRDTKRIFAAVKGV